MSKWDNRWMKMVDLVSTFSEDTSTKMGCVVVSKSNDLLSIGWNGLPRGIKNTPNKNIRPVKYKYFEHAERNTIYNSSRNGIPLKDSIIYISCLSCCDCTRSIIQSGIKKIVIRKNNDPEFEKRWSEDFKISKSMLKEAGIKISYL
jgi:dCMP deaminase